MVRAWCLGLRTRWSGGGLGVTRFFVRMGGRAITTSLDPFDLLRNIHGEHPNSFAHLLEDLVNSFVSYVVDSLVNQRENEERSLVKSFILLIEERQSNYFEDNDQRERRQTFYNSSHDSFYDAFK